MVKKKPTTKFKNTKIPLSQYWDLASVESALLKLGYEWKLNRPDLENLSVQCLHTHSDGSIKYSNMFIGCHDWDKHPGVVSEIHKGKIRKAKWVRGNPGPAPLYYIFDADKPPTEEEAPGGYITCSSSGWHQRSECLFGVEPVRCVLEPDTIGVEVKVCRNVVAL